MADSVVYPVGGMDYDSEDRSIEAGDYRYALNIRNSYAYAERRGVATNVKGTALIPYTLPQGENETIGYLEDTDERTGIYFVWNSEGNHSILRYYPQDVAPYGYIEKVLEFDFGWTQTERITGVSLVDNKLLYWTDSVTLRKINIVKANNTNKKKSWKVYLPNNYTQPAQSFSISIADADGNLFVTVPITFSGDTTREDAFAQIADTINANPTAAQYILAESCGCDMNLTEVQTNQVFIIVFSNANYFVVPENWYGTSPYEWFFNLAKIPPPYAPLTEYQEDVSYGFNNVNGFAWQHRTQNYYDDGEETVLSPYSQIPVNNNVCNENVNRALNYIQVNFNNSYAVDANALILLKRIRVIARKNNDAPDKKYIEIEPCEWLTIINGQIAAAYNFYNDTIEATISDSLALRLYDDVPLKSEGLAYAANRLVPANNLKNYNSPDCIEAEITQTFEGDQSPQLRRVRGKIRIFTPTMQRNTPNYASNLYYYQSGVAGSSWLKTPLTMQLRGGIFHDTQRTDEDPGGNYPFFGGGGFGKNSSAFGIRSGMESSYDQRIPEGGFPVYSAGTPLFTVSKQVNSKELSQDEFNAFDTNNQGLIDKIGEYFFDDGSGFNDNYSEFELFLPEGVHVLRLASHYCSFDDKLNLGSYYDLRLGTSWQATSTNVYAVFESNGLVKKGTTELVITVGGADIDDCGTFIVADLAPPHNQDIETKPWTNFCGYLYDDFGNQNINSPSWAGQSVEKAIIQYANTGGFTLIGQNTEVRAPNAGYWFTDHNGYFFVVCAAFDQTNTGWTLSAASVGRLFGAWGGGDGVNYIKSTAYGIYDGSLSALLNKDAVPSEGYTAGGNSPYLNQTNNVLMPTDWGEARDYCSTFVEGSVFDSNGIELVNATVTISEGRTRKTGQDGDYKILVWGDLKNYLIINGYPSTSNVSQRFRNSNDAQIFVYFRYGIICESSFVSNSYLVNLTDFFKNVIEQNNIPPYSPTSTFLCADNVAAIQDNEFFKTRKRGGNYYLNMRFYDRFGRLCSVVPVDEIYIPYFTEDLGLTLPNYPIGTFLFGRPTISWQLGNLPSELSWAHSYDFMWSKDTNYGYYLQWTVNSVEYLLLTPFGEGDDRQEEVPTRYENFDATSIKISITNIVDYYRANNNSLVSYEFQRGDRVRLIANQDNEYYTGKIIEFEVTDATDSSQILYLKNDFVDFKLEAGFIIEIYRPLDQADNDQQLFYETAERYPCTAPDTPLNDFSVKNGTFTSGDAYWRGRVLLVADEINKVFQVKPIVIEDSSISDFYASNSSDIGRFGIIDPNFNQAWFPTMLQNSGVYVTGSTVNGLSSFDLADNIELFRVFGDIKILVLIGDVLLAIQQSKVTSIYLQKILSIDANGAENFVTLADKFFGTQRPLKGDWGTNHPASVQQKDGLAIGWDDRLKQIWQYDANGVDSVVQKMSSFFTTLPEFTDDYVVGSVWDKFYNEYIFTAYNRNDNTGFTIAYQKDKNKWTTFYGFKHENYGRISNKIVSFVGGELYLHDVNEFGRNNFAGIQDTSVLKLVFNTEPFIEKIWFALRLEQKGLSGGNDWSAPTISNRNGQVSRLFKNAFRKIEEYWFAYFKRDLTTNVANPIANGKSMRSSSLTVELVNDSELEVELRTAIANTDAS